jgi:type II restriction enzyme
MEDLVEKYIIAAGFVKNINYFKEMKLTEIKNRFGLDLSVFGDEERAEKKFDFVVRADKMIYGIETNFYTGHGSKLNETARSYKMLYQEAQRIDGFKLVWITDGIGWTSAKDNLRETFNVMETVYNINDLEKGLLTSLLTGN